MKNRTSSVNVLISVTVIATLLVVILGAFAGGLILAPSLLDNAVAAPPAQSVGTGNQSASLPAAQVDIVAAYEQALIDLYQTALPSTVNIRVTKSINTSALDRFDFNLPPNFQGPDGPDLPEEFFNQGQGSGFVWDDEGHIVTNYHVIAGATEIDVIFVDGRTVEAEVLGGDPNADLAVLEVDVPASELQPLPLGDSEALQVGQLTVAIGNPFGQDFTMTTGIVSAVGRTIRSGNTPFSIPEVIQTDASINPGNSGGPLLNRQGEVIGINTQILSRSGGNAGVGFSVPINIAKQVIPVLMRGETFEYSWLGISGRSLDPNLAEELGLAIDTRGVVVITVAKDGPADEFGLRGGVDAQQPDDAEEFKGDIITAINGQPMSGMDELITYLAAETRPGDAVQIDVIRADGEEATLTVTLGVRPGLEELDQQDDE